MKYKIILFFGFFLTMFSGFFNQYARLLELRSHHTLLSFLDVLMFVIGSFCISGSLEHIDVRPKGWFARFLMQGALFGIGIMIAHVTGYYSGFHALAK